jgi:hypothetical protein
MSGPRPPAPPGQKVVVRDGDREVHGYALSSDGARVEVVWAVTSGRLRKKTFPAEDVFVPGSRLPWAGLPVAAERLQAPYRPAGPPAPPQAAGPPAGPTRR